MGKIIILMNKKIAYFGFKTVIYFVVFLALSCLLLDQKLKITNFS